MKKRILFGVICILIAVISTTALAASELSNNDTMTVMDQRGKEITIPENVERIITIPRPAASLLFALDGSTKRLAGMDPLSMNTADKDLLQKMAPGFSSVPTDFVNSKMEPNVEETLKLKPDVVFQWAHLGDDRITPLENAGIPVIGLLYGTQDDLEEWMNIFGTVLGKEEKAKGLIGYHQKIRQEIEEKTAKISEDEKPRVLYMYQGRKLDTSGSGTYNSWYINMTGCKNAAGEMSGEHNVNMEQIIKWDPEIILLGNFDNTTPSDLIDNNITGQDWSTITAIKNKQIYKVPNGLFRWDPPSQESPLMWEWLATIAHPELFNYDIKEGMKEFYKQYYNYSLTEGDIAKILNCDINSDSANSLCGK
jgi:iron complex transport system substrate-binding protein